MLKRICDICDKEGSPFKVLVATFENGHNGNIEDEFENYDLCSDHMSVLMKNCLEEYANKEDPTLGIMIKKWLKKQAGK